MDVRVETSTGAAFDIVIGHFDTVLEIKDKIQRKLGIPVSHQTLIFNGDVLPDDLNVQDSDIDDGSRIRIVIASDAASDPMETNRSFLQTPKLRLLVKKSESEPQPASVEVEITETVRRLKEKVHEVVGTPTERIVIHACGNQLPDDETLLDLGLSENSELTVGFLPDPSAAQPSRSPSPDPLVVQPRRSPSPDPVMVVPRRPPTPAVLSLLSPERSTSPDPWVAPPRSPSHDPLVALASPKSPSPDSVVAPPRSHSRDPSVALQPSRSPSPDPVAGLPPRSPSSDPLVGLPPRSPLRDPFVGKPPRSPSPDPLVAALPPMSPSSSAKEGQLMKLGVIVQNGDGKAQAEASTSASVGSPQPPFYIDISSDNTVLEIKGKIQEKQGTPVSKQTLIFNGNVLPDDLIVHGSDIHDGSQIQLAIAATDPTEANPPPSSKLRLFLYMMHGNGVKYVPIQVDIHETVLRLKEQIHELDGYPTERIVIQENGNLLPDDKTLHELGLTADDVVSVDFMPDPLVELRRAWRI